LARIKQVPRGDRSTQDGLGAFQDCRCWCAERNDEAGKSHRRIGSNPKGR